MSELVEALSTMEIGESIGMGDKEFMGVPGGWLVTTANDFGIASCFVPLPANQVAMPKIKSPILTSTH
jgi:hypothetical protein